MQMIKRLLRKIMPKWVLKIYHRVLAVLTWYAYGTPGNHLTIIGVTGTNGKSTVVQMVGHILRHQGLRVAWMSTATERIGDREKLNARKMTMPGHGELQRFMRKALKENCTHAVIEVSSQGIVQGRHIGVPFDVAAITNLTPEHIESHGSFEAYRDAKLQLFRHLASRRRKKFSKPQTRSLVLNLDDQHALEFLSVQVEKNFGTTQKGAFYPGFAKIFQATDQHFSLEGGRCRVDGSTLSLSMLGSFNIDNALVAIGCAFAIGIPVDESTKALADFSGVPGRLEFIQHHPFTVLVDYAPEPASMKALYDVANDLPHNRIIHVFGSAGGGRDTSRRPILGKFVGERADIAIVTNEDPYDEPPQRIIDQVAEGVVEAQNAGSQVTLYKIKERRRALEKAVSLAQPGDLVIATGKGCEQWIMGPLGSKKPWDERRIFREEIARLKNYPH